MNTERYDRILEALFRLAREGKTPGEREAARNRIKHIEEKMKSRQSQYDTNSVKFRLDKLNEELERKAQEELKRQAEIRRREQAKREEEQRKETVRQEKQERVYKQRAERKQKESMTREEKFAARANWLYQLVQKG